MTPERRRDAAVILVLPNLRPALPAPPTAEPAAGDDLRAPSPGQEAGAAEPDEPEVLITIAQGGPISEQDYDISDLARSPADTKDLMYLITDSVMREDW